MYLKALKGRAKLSKIKGSSKKMITKSREKYKEFKSEPKQLPECGPNNLNQIESTQSLEYPGSDISKRMIISVLVSLGFLISFGARCNIGVAALQMRSNMTDTGIPEITWTDETLGLVYSSFFWGYAVTQIPGGLLVNRLPAHRVFGSVIAASSCLNLLIPICSRLHPGAVIIVRIMQGLFEGVMYPACHGIWRKWAPLQERSKLATLAFAGSYGGSVISMPLSAFLTEYIGWPVSFYFYGLFGIIWYCFWYCLAFEKPATHPSISMSEKNYIEQNIVKVEHNNQPTFWTTPWVSFMTSMPVWAIIIANSARSWALFLLIISQPSYFKEVFNYDISESGLVLALPHLAMTIIVPIGGCLADYMQTSNILSTTNVRKLFNCGGFGMEALFMLFVAFAHDTTTATVCLTIAVGFSGFAISGFCVNHLDLSPRYAPVLMGISNGIGTFVGMFSPMLVEMLTKEGTASEWQIVFLIASFIHFIGVLFYAVFASGELQPWAEPSTVDENIIDTSCKKTSKVRLTNEITNGQTGGYSSMGNLNEHR